MIQIKVQTLWLIPTPGLSYRSAQAYACASVGLMLYVIVNFVGHIFSYFFVLILLIADVCSLITERIDGGDSSTLMRFIL
jgi:hypothetical protein